MKEIIRLIKSWWKVILTTIIILEVVLLITGNFISGSLQFLILLIVTNLLFYIKYKVEPDLKNDKDI